jgi:hypothetical protein
MVQNQVPFSVNFPIPFPTACLNVQVSPKNVVYVSNEDWWVDLISFTSTYFIAAEAYFAGYASSPPDRVSWRAIGY